MRAASRAHPHSARTCSRWPPSRVPSAAGSTFWVSVQRQGRLPVIKKGVPLPGISTRPGPGTSGPAQAWPTAGPGTENDTLQRQNQCSLGMALRGCRGSSTCPVSRGGAHSRSPRSTGPLSDPTPICHPCVALPPPRLPSLLKETDRGCWEEARRTRTTHAPRVPSKFSPARGASALRSARFPGWAEFHPHSRPVPLHPLAH